MRGLIFSAPMIRALLAGRKTQTRRIVKWEPAPRGDIKLVRVRGTNSYVYLDEERGLEWSPYANSGFQPWPADRIGEVCPLGGPGARVFVKEAISLFGERLGEARDSATYDADEELTPLDTWPWKRDRLPAMFMPCGLRRLELELTSVRVERLHAITEDDAKAEGIEPFRVDPEGDCWSDGKHRTAFEYAWNQIHGWNPNAWSVNPFVWTRTFVVHNVLG